MSFLDWIGCQTPPAVPLRVYALGAILCSRQLSGISQLDLQDKIQTFRGLREPMAAEEKLTVKEFLDQSTAQGFVIQTPDGLYQLFKWDSFFAEHNFGGVLSINAEAPGTASGVEEDVESVDEFVLAPDGEAEPFLLEVEEDDMANVGGGSSISMDCLPPADSSSVPESGENDMSIDD